MKIQNAIQRILVDRDLPVVTEYDLFRILRDLHFAGEYDGKKLRLTRHPPDRTRYRNVGSRLLSDRYLRPDPDFYPAEDWVPYNRGSNYARVFRVSDVPDGPAEDITALVDPFCYISHLSAMQRYSLTNRIPNALNLSTPKKWNVARDEKILADYGDLAAGDYVAPLSQLSWPKVIRRREVMLHKTVRMPVVKTVRGSVARIPAIGEVFVQMLDRPELCGGMEHVIEVWDQRSETYLDEIITAVDRAEESIIKVRAGYLLEERLGVRDDRILAWTAFAQRGGSRKLDAGASYVPTYSEKWMISLNAGNPDRTS
ncbi:putative transcriptional regulator of viral defense system [Rhizobium leguminosarum]|uniref:hypothetical protein n=1 Tax=Rhizobium leguminosarum TaxID=384 RepID=UPI0016161848|nr:hypothetical protein [Rhizobium leguminosarum]MBB5666342.1 putative transcriptional regulator of viral defense system [Rhizobium leguminosarum]